MNHISRLVMKDKTIQTTEWDKTSTGLQREKVEFIKS